MSAGSPISCSPMKRKTAGTASVSMPAVTSAFIRNANRRSARYDPRSRTSAVAADSSIMIGDSMHQASDVATPKAARLEAGAGNRATMAAM